MLLLHGLAWHGSQLCVRSLTSNIDSVHLLQERMMPGVIMATECKAFDKLYQLAELEEPRLVE